MPDPVSTRPVAVCTGCGAFTRSRSVIGETCGAPLGAPRTRRCDGVFLVVVAEDWRECRQCGGAGEIGRERCVRCQGTGWERRRRGASSGPYWLFPNNSGRTADADEATQGAMPTTFSTTC